MTNTMDGSESSETPPNSIPSDSMFSDTRPLGDQLNEHLENCSECAKRTEGKTRPAGFGMTSPFCSTYQDIIAVWAEKEGQINNIVDHDEFGNRASQEIHERYPDQWR